MHLEMFSAAPAVVIQSCGNQLIIRVIQAIKHRLDILVIQFKVHDLIFVKRVDIGVIPDGNASVLCFSSRILARCHKAICHIHALFAVISFLHYDQSFIFFKHLVNQLVNKYRAALIFVRLIIPSPPFLPLIFFPVLIRFEFTFSNRVSDHVDTAVERKFPYHDFLRQVVQACALDLDRISSRSLIPDQFPDQPFF